MRAFAPQQAVGDAAALVRIVDDDADVRLALQELMTSVGLDAAGFASPQELLRSAPTDRPGCYILDVRMPGSSGLDLQRHFASALEARPVIFLTGHGDIPMSVEAMKAGAVDFLTKPVRDQALLDAVSVALDRDLAQREAAQLTRRYVERAETLTPREHEVMAEVARGRLNKQIAYDLSISVVTVKLHRSNVMRKMETASVGELVRAWEALPPHIRERRT